MERLILVTQESLRTNMAGGASRAARLISAAIQLRRMNTAGGNAAAVR